MYSREKFNILSQKYGQIASWAIWDYRDSKDTKIIENNFAQLHSKYVLIALNFSRNVGNWPNWSNFHDNSHARKLKYACNETFLRGSYMTDLFKNYVKARSTNIEKDISYNRIRQNVDFFRIEMEDIDIDNKTRFIVFGKDGSNTSRLFNKYFRQYFKNRTIFFYHYSYFTYTDKEWVEKFWEKLGITSNYDYMIGKYKNLS